MIAFTPSHLRPVRPNGIFQIQGADNFLSSSFQNASRDRHLIIDLRSQVLAGCLLSRYMFRLTRRKRRQQRARARLKVRGGEELEASTKDPYEDLEQQRILWEEMWAGPEDAPEGTEAVLQQKRVMIMISDTGGGHRASAKAVADAFEELYPGQIEVTIRDVWTESCPWPFNNVVQMYMWMAKHPQSWRLFWYWSKFPLARWISQRFANVRCQKAFRRAIKKDNPDLVISVHPGCQHIVIKVLNDLAKETRHRIPFATVVTDLGSAHPMWFHPETDKIFVPSPQVHEMALRCGLRESAIQEFGLPLRRAFWAPETRSQSEIREVLGLSQKARTVLIVGGGDGVGRIQQIAEVMARELSSFAATEPEGAQMVVICGKNEKVKQKLEAVRWPKNVRAKIVGFVSNIDEWMVASDVIVTKAGPGTIAESCTRGLPVMLSSFLPGQERGNVDFVKEGGFGEYNTDPTVIAQTVVSWLKDPEELARRSKLAASHGRPKATTQIARVIGEQWLVADPGKLARVVLKALRDSADDISDKAKKTAERDPSAEECSLLEDNSAAQEECEQSGRAAKAEELRICIQELTQAQLDLEEAQASLQEVMAKVRHTLAEISNEPV